MRLLRSWAFRYGELIFDVNSAYFFNHGGYDFAKQFYADAYKAAVEIVGGEQYILSAVMHADARNRAMSEALGQDVYHYHLHVVYVPVVEKQILWSKRCKDKSMVGKVKETVMQVSMSKKWISKPAIDVETGEPILTSKGKPVLKKSYSVLPDDFFQYMRDAGYTDVERGERGSTEEHLTVTQFKVEREQERLANLTEKTEQKAQEAASLEKKIEKIQKQQVAVQSVEQIEAKPVPLSSKVMLERAEYKALATAAKKYITQEKKESIFAFCFTILIIPLSSRRLVSHRIHKNKSQADISGKNQRYKRQQSNTYNAQFRLTSQISRYQHDACQYHGQQQYGQSQRHTVVSFL